MKGSEGEKIIEIEKKKKQQKKKINAIRKKKIKGKM